MDWGFGFRVRGVASWPRRRLAGSSMEYNFILVNKNIFWEGIFWFGSFSLDWEKIHR